MDFRLNKAVYGLSGYSTVYHKTRPNADIGAARIRSEFLIERAATTSLHRIAGR
jgi:hypothetical protein